MKKILLLISSLITIVALAALPLACSHDEDDSYFDSDNDAEEVETYRGSVVYGSLSKNDVKVKIGKRNGEITISVETGIPYLSYEFKDLNINVSGDTSYFRAQSETIDAGTDAQLVLTLNGLLYDDCEELFLTVSGSELTDVLYFSTNPKDLEAYTVIRKDVDVVDIPSGEVSEMLNGVWEGVATFDGEEAGTMTFKTSINENGKVDVDLGRCKFSEKAPEMNIVLKDMVLHSVNAEGNGFGLYGKSANYVLGSMEGSLGAQIDGIYEDGYLSLELSLSVLNSNHTVSVTKAQPKK